METLLGATDASRPLQWWGYVRGDGTIILKRYVGMDEIKSAVDEPGITHVRGPFIAFGYGAARAKLSDKIATAKVKIAQRRREAMAPA
jgi:hypothetical protein